MLTLKRLTASRSIARTTLLAVIATVVTTFAPTAPVEAQDVLVVVHPGLSINEITSKDIRRIFFKQKSRWPNGERAKPVDQKMNSELRKPFSETVLDRSLQAVDSYWNSQVFAGKGSPPPTVDGDSAVLDFVRTTPGAVGYVSAGADTSAVKILRIAE